MPSGKNENREKQNGEGTGSKTTKKRMKKETDEFTLRNVLYFMYDINSKDQKECLFYDPDYVRSSAYIKGHQKFLDVHFAGYLSEEKSEKRNEGEIYTCICGVDMRKESKYGELANTRLDLLGGEKNRKGKGKEVRAAFLKKIQADHGHYQGFSKVVSDMEKQNCEVLKSWNLDMETSVTKLEKFIERMRNGEKSANSKLLDMPNHLKKKIFDLVEQQVQKRTWESMATAITWILIAALLRGDTGNLQPYYQRMGEHGEPSAVHKFSSSIRNSPPPEPVPIYSLYSNPDEIKPYTMEDIGNLRNTYVERTAALYQIYEKMHSDRVNEKKYVYISGIGGCGKTELARAYAYNHREEYDEIFWFTCDEEEMPGVEKLLADSPYGETVTVDNLKQMDERCLLILDNCNSISSGAIRELHQKTGKAHLLVTTRLAVITQIRPEQILYLNESLQDNRDFAFQVFCSNYFAETDIWGNWGEEKETAGKEELSEEEKTDIESICRFVWYHPMAVAMIAVMLRENREEESIELFAANCRLGLNQVFPMGERIPFGQGEQDYDEEPLEILKELFARFPRRSFTIRERQVLKILQLFPARQVDMKMLCGLLGDSSMDKSVKNDCRTLSSLQWIQSNGVWVTMHPLISQVLEIDPGRISLENETEFYRIVLEKWMYSVNRDPNSGKDMFFIHQLWKKSGVSEEKSTLNLAVSLLMDKRNAKVLFEELYPEVTFAFTAIVREQGAMYFVYNDLMQREEVVFYQIRGEEERKLITEKKKTKEYAVSKEEWVKLVFLSCRETAVRLDFPDCILGHEIEEIPGSFCSKNENISGLRLPQRLREIGWGAFKECEYMSGELVLPETLEIIGDRAFEYCPKLRGNLLIPGGVKKIGNGAFCRCGMDGTLTICEGVEEVGSDAFAYSGVCGIVIIPDTVKRIGDKAFLNCGNLTEVVLPKGLIKIGAEAFCNCCELRKGLEIPRTVRYIGNNAFSGCSKWKGILNLPGDLEHLGKNAFAFCENLSGIIRVPDQITIVLDGVFRNCNKLKICKDTFCENLMLVGSDAFSGCDCPDGCLELPERLSIIGHRAFSNCSNIREVRFGRSFEIMGSWAFENCTNLEKISGFPNTLKKIGKGAFLNCTALNGCSEFLEGVEEIGDYAFGNCISLEGKLSFHEGLMRVGHYAFSNCSSLTDIDDIPESLKLIYPDTFEGCTQLVELEIMNLLFPEHISCVTEDGELIVPDDMDELTESWLEGKKEFLPERIVIPEQIVKIGKNAFCDCTNLKAVVLPSQLRTIEPCAFANCSNLKKLVLPDTLQEIGYRAFANCSGLECNLVFPFQIKNISDGAFEGCSGIERIILPKNLESIGKGAFFKCYELKEVQMFENLLEIDSHAFGCCCSLKKIKFPMGLKKIGPLAFLHCRQLEKIQLPECLEEIESGAFWGCSELKGELVIPEKIRIGEEKTFFNCHFSQIIIKNPDMRMDSLVEIMEKDSPIIWGYEDSTAFAYALKYSCPFRDIREWPGFDSQDTSMTLL